MAATGDRQDRTCKVVRAGEAYQGKQALAYAPGISAESVGATALNLQLVTIPPNGRAKAHLHVGHESAAYVLQGEIGLRHGEQLEHQTIVRAGEFVYIPAGVPHLPYNAGATDAVAILARSDPNEQESVVLLPELDGYADGDAV